METALGAFAHGHEVEIEWRRFEPLLEALDRAWGDSQPVDLPGVGHGPTCDGDSCTI